MKSVVTINKAKIVPLVTAAFMLLALLGGCSPVGVFSPYTSSPAPAFPIVTVKQIIVSDKYVDIRLDYPEVSGMADAAFQSSFNAAVKADMEKQVRAAQALAREVYDQRAESGFFFAKFTIDGNVKISLNDGKLLSMYISLYKYMGGAHGTHDYRFYTFMNTPAAKQLSLLKLFTDPAKAKSRIEKFIVGEIIKSPENYFQNPDVSVDNTAWFTITGTNLHIFFPEYSIAPYACGTPEFIMPLSAFKDIMIPELQQ